MFVPVSLDQGPLFYFTTMYLIIFVQHFEVDCGIPRREIKFHHKLHQLNQIYHHFVAKNNLASKSHHIYLPQTCGKFTLTTKS